MDILKTNNIPIYEHRAAICRLALEGYDYTNEAIAMVGYRCDFISAFVDRRLRFPIYENLHDFEFESGL